jgi:hypothetical protein
VAMTTYSTSTASWRRSQRIMPPRLARRTSPADSLKVVRPALPEPFSVAWGGLRPGYGDHRLWAIPRAPILSPSAFLLPTRRRNVRVASLSGNRKV